VVLSDESLDSIDLLRSGLVSWSYEQDEYHTPRITGYVLKKNEEYEAGISIIRDKGLNQSQNDLYRVPLISGQGKMITTYRGENIRPTPSFQDEPFSVEIDAHSAQDMTNAIYEALQPKAGREDLRVSVMSIYLDQSTGHHDIAIRNAVDERLHLNA
jgi:IMP cyclohydrolase